LCSGCRDAGTRAHDGVRGSFLQTIQGSNSHWHNRPILPDALAPGIDIFAPETRVPGAYDDPHAL
jgi:hypothetical protein